MTSLKAEATVAAHHLFDGAGVDSRSSILFRCFQVQVRVGSASSKLLNKHEVWHLTESATGSAC